LAPRFLALQSNFFESSTWTVTSLFSSLNGYLKNAKPYRSCPDWGREGTGQLFLGLWMEPYFHRRRILNTDGRIAPANWRIVSRPSNLRNDKNDKREKLRLKNEPIWKRPLAKLIILKSPKDGMGFPSMWVVGLPWKEPFFRSHSGFPLPR